MAEVWQEVLQTSLPEGLLVVLMVSSEVRPKVRDVGQQLPSCLGTRTGTSTDAWQYGSSLGDTGGWSRGEKARDGLSRSKAL